MTAAADADLQSALRQAQVLLASDPPRAADQARELLRSAPDQPNALMLLALAQRQSGEHTASLQLLQRLCALRPDWAAADYELGRGFSLIGRHDLALPALRRAVEKRADAPQAWQALGDAWLAVGDTEQAQQAYLQKLRHASAHPALMRAADALARNELPTAERLLKAHLHEQPTDIAAIRMLGETAARLGRQEDALALLSRCIELAPDFHEARLHLALMLNRANRPQAALDQLRSLLTTEPRHIAYRNLQAVLLGQVGEYEQAIAVYEGLLEDFATHPKIWLSYAHALKTANHTERAVAAYRECIRLQPDFGEAYWSLANLKTVRFDEDDIGRMRAHLRDERLQDEDRFHFDFALAKALEDRGDYEAAFRHYHSGNALRLSKVAYSPEVQSRRVDRQIRLLSPGFLHEREGLGYRDADQPTPIFILGMPRAGSTLIEQILSSHPQVEGTMELPDITALTRRLRRELADANTYADTLEQLAPERWATLGREYLERTAVHRKRGAPFFIDKMPNNFAHVGLIHLILPNAKIIDARRHPLACGFSNFKQHFARGQHFSYRLEDMGRYYADYVRLMAHVDAVLPGRVHRVFYERMVEDTETEVRHLLDYCGLPFDPACLRFFENDRAVRTASSEQVRRPIYRDGVDHWQHFAPWLAPLEQALGDVLSAYPQVPDFPPPATADGGPSP